MKCTHFQFIPRPLRALLAAAVLTGAPGTGIAAPAEPAPVVYVIPVTGQSEPALTYVVRRGIRDADRQDAAAIILRMDTLGGRLDATEEICDLLKKSRRPLITFVEKNAISAGAIIAMTTTDIYMAPGSKIGDAMPISMGQSLGEAEREKAASFTASMLRSNAEHGGHDPALAETMVRRDAEFTIGEDVVSPKGQLLTLTASEAVRAYGDPPQPLLARAVVEDFDTLLDQLGYGNAEIRTLETSALEQMARWIAMLAPILMMIGVAAIYMEFQTPGFGLPAAVAILCFTLYFFGHHIAGLAGMEELVVFMLGIALLTVELFVIPGFGITGLLGVAMILWALTAAMVEHLPGDPWIPSWPDVRIPFVKMVLALVFGGALIGVINRYLPRNRLFQRLVLSTATSQALGFRSSVDESSLVGSVGSAVTDLRPGGAAHFGDRRLDVVTRGNYLGTGTAVRVAEVHGSRIVVERAPPEPPEAE